MGEGDGEEGRALAQSSSAMNLDSHWTALTDRRGDGRTRGAVVSGESTAVMGRTDGLGIFFLKREI